MSAVGSGQADMVELLLKNAAESDIHEKGGMMVNTCGPYSDHACICEYMHPCIIGTDVNVLALSFPRMVPPWHTT